MSQHSVHRCLIRCPHYPYVCPQMSICLSTVVPTACPQMSRDAVHRAHDHVHRCPMTMSTDVQASCPHCPCFCPHMSKGGVHICPRWPMLLSTCCPHMSKVAVHYCPQCRDNCGQSILSTVVHTYQRPRCTEGGDQMAIACTARAPAFPLLSNEGRNCSE